MGHLFTSPCGGSLWVSQLSSHRVGAPERSADGEGGGRRSWTTLAARERGL